MNSPPFIQASHLNTRKILPKRSACFSLLYLIFCLTATVHAQPLNGKIVEGVEEDKGLPTLWVAKEGAPASQTTFKEVFLSDIQILEKRGITHPDMKKVKTLLGQ
ncbi:MAG: hypothetical protein AAF824_19840 [Bacteroidota bacterium]